MSNEVKIAAYVPVTRQVIEDAQSDALIYDYIHEGLLDVFIGPRYGPPRPAKLRGPSLWRRLLTYLGVR